MKQSIRTKARAGSKILESVREVVEWAEGRDVAVRVSTMEVPVVDVKETRRRLGLSQRVFAAKFGFQTATLRNWEQGRTYPDGPARVLLAVIAKHPEAVEDSLRKASWPAAGDILPDFSDIASSLRVLAAKAT
jgi:putative transcriptional regulator